MRHFLVLSLLTSLLVPASAFAATVSTTRTQVFTEPVEDNAYLAGSELSIVAPFNQDLVAAAGSIVVSAPVGGDAMLAGGRVDVRKPVAGDVRVAAGEFLIDSMVGGDLVATAGMVTASTSARETHLMGGSIRVAGAGGAVTVYGADITLSGNITGDVTVYASDRLTIAEGTHIFGALKYDAPQQVSVPASARIDGGVTYTGSSSFLPTSEEAKRFAVAGAGVLLIVRILAMVVAAGLITGLLPKVAYAVVERVLDRSLRRSVLFGLLGFGVIVATPVLIIMLLVSFVGFMLALMLAALYVLMLALAYIYAGVIAGTSLMRAISKRNTITWKTAVIGTLALYIVSVVPVIGMLVVLLLTSAALGALIAAAYQHVYGSSSDDLADFAETSNL